MELLGALTGLVRVVHDEEEPVDGELLAVQLERPHRGMVHGRGVAQQGAHVVSRPQRAEPRTCHGELTDELDRTRVVHGVTYRAAEHGDEVGDRALPVVVELALLGIEQQRAQPVASGDQTGREHRGERVGGEDVEVAALDERRQLERGQKMLQPRGDALGTRAPPRPRRVRGGERDEVVGLDIVQSQHAREGLEHLPGRVVVAPPLEPEIVVGADAREHRHLLPAQPRHSTVRAGLDARLLWCDEVSTSAQIRAQPVRTLGTLHALDSSRDHGDKRGSCRSPGPAGLFPPVHARRSIVLPRSITQREEFTLDITDRTVLIVGGTSGIGLGLARRYAAAGSTVVVGGRNTDRVDDLETVRIDVTDPASVAHARDEVLAAHPGLDTVVTMSGIMVVEDLRDPAHFGQAEATIAVNLLGTIRVLDAFTPHLIGRGAGDIVTVTSGIGFMPFPLMPTYGASKAAVHSYTESLRRHLVGTGVQVTELIPPAVANAGQEKLNPAALPLDDFLDEVIGLLTRNPTPDEIVVERALPLRWAERDGTYAELLERRSQSLSSLPSR